jgi:hypothetical protein
MIVVSFKHPRKKKLIYRYYLMEKGIPKQITHGRKVYFLYGRHS